jgi:hypothetical protein
MTLNIPIQAGDLSLWTMLKFFAKVAVAAMPAYVLWTFVQSLILPFWLSVFHQMIRQ